MDASIVNLLLTLFIATFTVTGVLWLALYATGQAKLNTSNSPDSEKDSPNG